MHGDAAFLANWAKDFEAPRDGVKVLVCPSAPYLSAARALLPETVFLGAQNVARWPEDGAYTGEISAQCWSIAAVLMFLSGTLSGEF